MRVLIVALCVALCSYQVSAWRLWSNHEDEADETPVPTDPISATETSEDVMAECLRAGREGRCEFYECIENRFPCGPNGYTNKISKHFCRKIDTAFSTFDAFGKVWLNKTSICLMSDMLDIYRSDLSTCAEIKQAGIDGIINCNNRVVRYEGSDRTFCDFIGTNRRRYGNLMGMEEMNLLRGLGNTEILRSMIVQGLNCGAQMLSQHLNQLGQTVSNFASSVSQNLRNLMSWD